MSRTYIAPALRQTVTERCQFRCAYCQTAAFIVGTEFTIDHIIPRSLGGLTIADNLCLACWSCNLFKQDQIAALDPDTGETARLFHPFHQHWREHFAWQQDGLLIIGLTSTGRATVNALRLNRPPLQKSRHWWIAAGWHPPMP